MPIDLEGGIIGESVRYYGRLGIYKIKESINPHLINIKMILCEGLIPDGEESVILPGQEERISINPRERISINPLIYHNERISSVVYAIDSSDQIIKELWLGVIGYKKNISLDSFRKLEDMCVSSYTLKEIDTYTDNDIIFGKILIGDYAIKETERLLTRLKLI